MDINNPLVDLMVDDMMKHTEVVLGLWLVHQDKELMLAYYNKLSLFEQTLLLDALTNVVSKANTESEEFRQAGIDIPEYIKAQTIH